jgi:hypothetical protein
MERIIMGALPAFPVLPAIITIPTRKDLAMAIQIIFTPTISWLTIGTLFPVKVATVLIMPGRVPMTKTA